ncbi:uncharacterized protein LOC119066185 [Bradysia coprophila]|uniref:uncharacterized protein LOC119066185 n=1 Tax=Bradysia coprophila TaxID=38358 RepID=UPI00187DC7A1|nr:uncharacterized protein LOC119066185 [Bradysia coprophila]
MSALLHESPVARVTPRHLFSRADSMHSHSVAHKPLVDNKLDDEGINKSTKNSTVVRKSLTITGDSSATENNSTGTVPSNKAFCKMFSGWLENTERESDSERFDRLKEDLWKLVGKYALEMHKDE